MRTRGSALVVALAAILVSAPAAASPIGQQLSQARADREAKLVSLAQLRGQLHALSVRYSVLERQAGRASLRLVTATLEVQEAQIAVAVAQAMLDRHARTVYEVGPSGVIEALLSAETFADVAAANEYSARALGADADVLQATESTQAVLAVKRAGAARMRQQLVSKQMALASILAEMGSAVTEAERLADRAGRAVASLEAQQAAIESASEREAGRDLIVGGVVGADQSKLLALLGPTGGRTCEIPDGLRDTGNSFSGLATWYGWEFAGQGTASGAVFDPRLFTAANRWLPFGSFVRVRYGGKCAIVLINDRGPFGDGQRVLDLSIAAASYLGVGMSPVRADILVPVEGIPG
ncbi:MAG TPA: RlpA-like double-psi beta-barrel domain-containing protein [Actinomycetota bacterium]|jgi:rare lipoprotein A (peptidoglycan hydrolase)|nr:RlpA-like double-psi beta-barrel domain-containing protein [Actinomycetota bacterium]